MKARNKFFAVLLTLAMLLSMLPMGAMAEETLPSANPPGVTASGDVAQDSAAQDSTAQDSAAQTTAAQDPADNALLVSPMGPQAGGRAVISSGTGTWNGGDTIDAPLAVTGDITVNGTVTVNAPITVNSGTVTFSGSGTLRRGAGFTTGTLLTVNGGSVTLNDITVDGANVPTQGNNGTVGGSCVRVNGGTFTLTDGSTIRNGNATAVQGTTDGGGVYVAVGGTFNMTGGSITGCHSSCGGGVFNGTGGTFNLSGGSITGNTTAGGYGGGLGGGVFNGTDGTFTMSGGSITGNESEHGGLYANADTTTLSGTAFVTGNTNAAGTPMNLVVASGKKFACDSFASGAKIGITGTGAVATGVDYAKVQYLYADTPLTSSLKLGDGTALASGATAALNLEATPGVVRIKTAPGQSGSNLPTTWYPTLAAAVAAHVADDAPGNLDDDDGRQGSHRTIEVLADCTFPAGVEMPTKGLLIVGEKDASGKPVHTLTIAPNAYIATKSATTLENLKVVATGISDVCHTHGALTVKNCEITVGTPENGMFNIVAALDLQSGVLNAAGKLTSGASFTMTTGDGATGVTAPTGFFKLNKNAKITLGATSTAPTDPLKIQVANDAASGNVIASCTNTTNLAAIAAKITIGNGEDWKAVVDGNNIVLKAKTAYVLIDDANPATDDGSLGNPYRTLADAYANVADGGEIRILSHMDLSDMLECDQNKTVTITSAFRNGDGSLNTGWHGAWTVRRADAFNTQPMLEVTGGGTVKLKNLVLDGGNIAVTLGRLLNVGGLTAGTVELGEGAVLQNSKTTSSGAGAYVFGNGTLRMNGGTIQNCAANNATGSTNSANGGGVYVAAVGKFDMASGDIQNCLASYGGGVYNQGTFTMTGGTISGNKTDNGYEGGRGGGVFDGGTVLIKAGNITGNHSAVGGGVHIVANSTFTTQPDVGKEIRITGNTATSMGAGAYLEGGTLKFDSVGSGKITITDNTVDGKPSNLYLQNPNTMTYFHDDAAQIGITMGTPGFMTTENASNLPEQFISDDHQYKVVYEATKLKLVADPNVYINAVARPGFVVGHDGTGDGSFEKPFFSFDKAYASAQLASGGEIRVLSDYGTIGATTTFADTKPKITIRSYTAKGVPSTDNGWALTRSNTFQDTMFHVTQGAVTFQNITLDGNKANVTATGALAYATGSAQLEIAVGASLQNQKSAHCVVGADGDNAAVNMTGGRITGNEVTGNAHVVYVGTAANSKFTMPGGSISGNTTGTGYALFNDKDSSGITLGGAAIISGNTNAEGKPANLYLKDNETVAIAATPLAGTAKIGVTVQTPPAEGATRDIATGATNGQEAFFVADNAPAGDMRFATDKVVLKTLLSEAYVANDSTGEGCTIVGDDTATGAKTAPFATLAHAYAEVKNGGTIYVMDDLTCTAPILFDLDRAVTITSCKNNGDPWGAAGDTHSLKRNLDGSLFNISKGTITLKNIQITDARYHGNSPICIHAPSKLVLDTGAIITGTQSHFGAVYLFSGTLEMQAGSAIRNNTNTEALTGATINGAGGAVTVAGNEGGKAHFVMTGGTISGNKVTHATALGGGVYVGNGDMAVSGEANISGNTAANATISNVYLPTNQTIRVADRLSGTANISVFTQSKAQSGRPVKIATDATAADVAFFHADEMGKAGPVLRGSDIYLDVANKALVQVILPSPAAPKLYETFDAAAAAITADMGKGDLDDNDRDPSHYTIELLGNCTTVNGWPAVPMKITGATAADGGPKYTLTITGLVAPKGGGNSELTNIRLISKDGTERFHAWTPMEATNCDLSSFAVANVTAKLNSGKVLGNIRVDANANSQLSMKAGAVAVTGEIQFGHADGKVTLLADSTATQHYNVRYAKNIDLTGSKVIMEGAASSDLAKAIAKNVTVSGGSDNAKEWLAIGSGTNVIVKEAKSYWVSENGSDNGDGTYARPYKTIQHAYDVAKGLTGETFNPGIDIRVLTDLAASTATFDNAGITSVKISSYLTENGKADKAWTLKNDGNVLNVSKGSVNLENIQLSAADPAKDQKANIVVVNGANLTLNRGAKISDFTNTTAGGSGAWGTILLENATLTMNDGAELSNLTTNTGNIRMINSTFDMNGGLISGLKAGDNNEEGTAVYIAHGSTFTMSDGKITGCGVNENTQANGTIYLHATGVNRFVMSGGEITGNTATLGGGVYNANANNTITVSGTAKITGNTKTNGESSNVYLATGQTLAIGAGQMASGANIGVYCQNMPDAVGETRVFATNAVETDGQYFTSDKKTEAGILYKDEQVLFSYDARYVPPTGGGGGTEVVGPGPGITVTPGPGTVTVSPANPEPGKEVIITIHPETGWEVDQVIIVTVPGGEPVPVTGINPLTYIAPNPTDVKITVKYKRIPTDPKVSGVAALLNSDAHMAYLLGDLKGKFNPEKGITRAEVAQMFYNLLRNQSVDAQTAFRDVNDTAWCAKAVNTLAALGILQGKGQGKYQPNEQISRAEFTAIALRFAKNIDSTITFADVDDGYWAHDYIVGAAQYGWIMGYADSTFKPHNPITRAEAAKIVNTMLGRFPDKKFIDGADGIKTFPDVKADHWAFYEIAEATNSHAFSKDKNNVETWTD